MEKTYKIEISHKTIIFTIIFFLFLRFLWLVKDLLFSLFIAVIIMSALDPFVLLLQKRKIPRGLAVFIVYFLTLSIFINVISFIFPPLLKETGFLFKNLPVVLKSLSPKLSFLFNLESLNQYLPNITAQFFSLVKNIFSNIIFTISTLFFGFYFLIEENLIKKLLIKFFEEEQSQIVVDIFNKAKRRLSAWFWGQLCLMIIVGVMTYIGLNLIGMPYSLALAVLAGLLEVIPTIGPLFSAVPAVLIGFSQSSFLALANIALYFIVQQTENNLFVPLVMKKMVGLNPIVTMIVLIIGGRLAGAVGVILAVPTTIFIETILIELIKSSKSVRN